MCSQVDVLRDAAVFVVTVLIRVCMCVCVCRAEVTNTVENVDMSLEELQQLLLRSQQPGAEARVSTALDVSGRKSPFQNKSFVKMKFG